MDDFIVKDDCNLDDQQALIQREMASIKRKMGAKNEYSECSSISDMEAGYDDIQYEEK